MCVAFMKHKEEIQMNGRNSVYLETDAVCITHFFIGNEIRIQFIEGEPWLVFKDLCDALEIKNPSRVVRAFRGEAIYKSQCVTGSGRRFIIVVPLGEVTSFLQWVIQRRTCREPMWRVKREKVTEFLEWMSDELIPYVENHERGNV